MYGVDIGLAEMLVPMTNTEHFSKSLEIQQSEWSRMLSRLVH